MQNVGQSHWACADYIIVTVGKQTCLLMALFLFPHARVILALSDLKPAHNGWTEFLRNLLTFPERPNKN